MILSVLLLAVIPIGSEGAKPEGSISFDTTEQTANVGPGEDGIVNFTGTVEVDAIGPGQNIQYVVVTLEAACTWPSTVSPATIYFTAEETGNPKPFNVSTKVPNFTPATNSSQIVVTGSVRTMPGTPVSYKMSPATGIITIAPYAILTLSCEEPTKNVEQGRQTNYSLRVKNDGNDKGIITPEFQDIDDFHAYGLGFTFSERSMFVYHSSEEMLNISLYVSDSTRVNTYNFNVLVELNISGEIDTEEYRFFVDVTVRGDDGDGENVVNGGGNYNEGADETEDEGGLMPGFDLSLLVLAVLIVVTLLRNRVKRT